MSDLNFSWTSSFKISLGFYQAMGLWPKPYQPQESFCKTFALSICLFIVLFVHILTQVINIYFIRDSLGAVTSVVYIIFAESIVIFKIHYLLTNMRSITVLLETYDNEMFRPRNSEQLHQIEINLKKWRFTYWSFLSFVILVNMFWIISPIWQGTGSVKQLPHTAWYPFDVSTSPGYEIAWMYQITSTGFSSIVQLSFDSLMTGVNAINASQFDILNNNLRNLNKLGQHFKANLVYCVEHHERILNFVRNSNQVFNWLVLLQFFVSSLSIGMGMFQLTLVIPLSNAFWSLIMYTSCITAQIFMYCWVGNEVEVKSQKTAYAVFESEWTDFPQELKKDLLNFTTKLQKPLRLSSYNLFYLNLETFIRLIKTAWSYFTLMHHISSKK